MIDFWLYSALLILAGMLAVVWPIWTLRHSRKADRTALNVALYEERVAELGSQLAAGEVTVEQHDSALEEAGKLLLEDTARADGERRPTRRGGAWPLVVSAGVLPLVVIALYFSWGNPAGVQLVREMADNPVPEDLDGYIDRMERITDVQPENGEVWYMLGRAYLGAQRPQEAAGAFAASLQRLGERPEVLAQMAQAQFFANGNQLDTDSVAALDRALELNPNEPTALGLLGIAAFESGEYAGAIGYWERLLAGMPPGSEGAMAIQGGIDRARERMQEAGTTSADTAAAAEQQLKISVRVELADELAEAFGDDAVVFVSARDPQGPPMPLFAQRLSKAELPAEVVLDASDALMPGIQLQQGQTLQLSARISANGDVMQASHESRAVTLTAGDESDKPTVLQIDRTL
ncbi:cytochrome c-type biogenesis protein [Pseudomonas saudimassiliensis]|uniref:Cytochrome c-type biogenesis protein n=1 Tax=Pseudomonas saudimassiliensis TaxID=1461581 RepID=A0A078MAB4_9PSED|nr:c-type cytochrome biogenesis protein CcmI [Pseudomonas saudimassiliensis]CEA01611.1 cytochrome c-type biogenesis protein [Pseudomonas saudimassiliensis]CEF25567.1 cytochrome c-type biogenesis protein [Pseudomonas saudimassiliensis]